MKKFFLILTVAALGLFAAQSCKCTKSTADEVEFVYDVVGTAEGTGSYDWSASKNEGTVSLNGSFAVNATNDTTSAKVFADEAICNALSLSESLVSEDAEIAEAARLAQSKLLLDLNLNGISGTVKLGLTGYVKYGPMIFAIDENWQYPPINEGELTAEE